jgi:hypothetical protein
MEQDQSSSDGPKQVSGEKAGGFAACRHHLCTVTPFSKLVAAIVVIILPFLGAYVGYQYAPEKVVEVEKIVVNEVPAVRSNEIIQNNTDQFIAEKERHYISAPVWLIEDTSYPPEFKLEDTDRGVVLESVSERFREQRSDNQKKIELLTFSYGDLQNMYFITGIPDSGGCCMMVRYNLASKTFYDVEEYHGPLASVVANRYLVTGIGGSRLEIYDLSNELTLVNTITLNPGQTLVPAEGCSASPLPYDMHDIVVSDNGYRVFYSLYQDIEISDCQTTRPLIRINELELDHKY